MADTDKQLKKGNSIALFIGLGLLTALIILWLFI